MQAYKYFIAYTMLLLQLFTHVFALKIFDKIQLFNNVRIMLFFNFFDYNYKFQASSATYDKTSTQWKF